MPVLTDDDIGLPKILSDSDIGLGVVPPVRATKAPSTTSGGPPLRLAPAPTMSDVGSGIVDTIKDIGRAQMEPIGPEQPSPTRELSDQDVSSLPTAAKVGIVATRAAQGVGDVLRTPFTYETLGIGPAVEGIFGVKAAPAIQKALSAAFAGQMTQAGAQKAGELVTELKKPKAQQDTKKILDLGGGLITDATFGAATALHAATPEIPPARALAKAIDKSPILTDEHIGLSPEQSKYLNQTVEPQIQKGAIPYENVRTPESIPVQAGEPTPAAPTIPADVQAPPEQVGPREEPLRTQGSGTPEKSNLIQLEGAAPGELPQPAPVESPPALPQPPVSEAKAKKGGFTRQIAGSDRPHDIIDDIQNIIGPGGRISMANASKFNKDFRPSGANKSMFAYDTGQGHKLDDIAQRLRDQGIHIEDEGQLLDLIHGAAEARKGNRFREARENKAATKLGAMEKGTGDLLKGQTEDFSLSGGKGTDFERIQQAKEQAERDKAESEKGQTEFGAAQSLGGATKADPAFAGDGDYVSNMFAAIDRDRAAMGKPPMEPTKRRTWDEDNQKALAMMNRDPNWIPSLIANVERDPRPLRSWEQAGMVWHRQKLKAEAHNAAIRINTAFEDGRVADQAEARLDLARYEDEILSLDDVVGRNGTGSEAGRSLQAQKMGAGDDFTLIEMRLEKRAVNGGRPLTPTEDAEIAKLHAQIEDTQRKYDTDVATAKEREANLEAQLAIEKIRATPPESKPVPPHVRIIADRIKATFDARAKAALIRLQGKTFALGGEQLADLADLGASKILSGVAEGVAWADEMVRDLGESIRPHLKTIWDAAQKAIGKELGSTPLETARAVQQSIKQMTPEQRVERYAKAVGEKLQQGKKDSVTNLVQKLARAIVEGQPTIDRDDLIDRVHAVIQKLRPETTRSEARDMISGYGDFKQLSKDQISLRLRDLKGQMQQVAKLEAMQKGKPPLKTGLERRIPSREESLLIRQVNDAKREFQVPVDDPTTQLKSPLDTLKTRMQTRILDYEKKLADKDFSTRQKREIKLDADTMKLRADAERAKDKYKVMLRADQLKNRPKWQKIMDAVVKWRQVEVISGIRSIFKLTAAAVEGIGVLPMRELAGAAIGKMPFIREAAKKASLESGSSVRIEAKALAETWRHLIDDFGKKITGKRTDYEAVFGKQTDGLPPELHNWAGLLHSALKSPLKRNAFTRAQAILEANAIKKGIDTTDPITEMEIGRQALDNADFWIFQNKNVLTKAYRAGLAVLEQRKGGVPSKGGKLASTVIQVELPVVSVPSNLIARVFEGAFGTGLGTARLIAAYTRGIENLTPKEADLIMRNFKTGSVGAAFFLMGVFNPSHFGGFYEPGKKRDKKDVPFGATRIGDVTIPAWLTDNPFLVMSQAGATMTRVASSKWKKSEKETKGMLWGAYAAAAGAAEQQPFVRDAEDVSKLVSGDPRYVLGEQAKSLLVPMAVQNVAEWGDKKNGEPVVRKPKTPLQHVELGIPGLRQTVPVGKP